MECAYDNKILGQQSIVYAKKLKKIKHSSSPESSKQYTCPYCGEYVRYIHSYKINPYFRHIRGSYLAKSCEKYVDGIDSDKYQKSNYQQKIAGFPLYIRKFGENFALFLGLFPVPEHVIKKEIRESQQIEIFNPNNAILDHIFLNDLVVDDITFKPLNWLYESYSLKYANLRTPLLSDYKWVSETPGIGSEGALFFCSDTYSRRVALNGKITTETNYYLAIPPEKTITQHEFLKIESINQLAVKTLGYHQWSVYKIEFTEMTDESSEFARDLHVTLVEKPKQLTPLWPPHIQNGNRHVHMNECHACYLLQSNNPITEANFVKNVDGREFPVEYAILNANSALLDIGVTQRETAIPLEDGISQFSAVTQCRPSFQLPPYVPPIVQIQYGKNDVQNSEELEISKNSKLQCTSTNKCTLCHLRDNHIKSLFTNSLDFPEILDIKAGDRFFLIHGLDILHTINFPIKNGISGKNPKELDHQFYQTLIQQKGQHIATPIILKYLLPHSSEYPKVKSYIQNSFRKGNIPKPAYDHLINNILGELSK